MGYTNIYQHRAGQYQGEVEERLLEAYIKSLSYHVLSPVQ